MGALSAEHGCLFYFHNTPPVMIVIILSISSLVITTGQSIKAQLNINTQINAQYGNLAVDNSTGYVYVGLMNELYQLDSNLNVLNWVSTGPQLDDPACFDPGSFGQSSCSSGTLPVNTSNFNQILLIDSQRQNLITCGTLFQGTCQTRKLNNISTYTDFRDLRSQFVASNYVDQPTIAFVGPGPFGDSVLYVSTSLNASTNTQYVVRKSSDGVVSSRYLDPSNLPFSTYFSSQFAYATGTNTALTTAAVNSKLFTYVAGFSLNGFSYFFSYSSDASFSSRIIQVCQKDQLFETYVDMKITCGNFGNVQSATWLLPGTLLKNNWGLSATEIVILAVFTSSTSADSAVCAYKLSDIRNRFTANIKLCNTDPTVVVSNIYYSSAPTRQCFANANVSIDLVFEKHDQI